MPIKNKYTISLEFPKTFQELLYRITKWRNTQQSLYNTVYNLKPYSLLTINITTDNTTNVTTNVNTFKTNINKTLKTLDDVGNFFERNSSYKITYEGNTANAAHQNISTEAPITTAASENIVFDIEHLYNGVIQILKTYGQFNKAENLWIMNSRGDSFKAYDLILNSYPIFPQLIYNFPYPNPYLPTLTQPTNSPMFKLIYDYGLDILLNVNANVFDGISLENLSNTTEYKTGVFKILYFNNSGTQSTVLNPIVKAQFNVTDENSYTNWYYSNN